MVFLQEAVRGALELDPQTREGFARLSGRVICLDSRGGPVVWLKATSEGLEIADADMAPAQLTLRGTPFALLRHLLAAGDGTAESGVTVEGDAALAQQLQRLMSGYRPDLEAEIAKFLGEAPARQLGSLARETQAYVRRVLGLGADNLGAYLREGARVVAPAAGVRAFLDEVDRLRADVERLEIRIRRLGS